MHRRGLAFVVAAAGLVLLAVALIVAVADDGFSGPAVVAVIAGAVLLGGGLVVALLPKRAEVEPGPER